MASTIWKGVIEFGKVRVPVRFFSAVQDQAVRFHLLHEKDRVRVRQAMVNPVTGEVVPNEQIRRGFEVERDTFVMVEEAELAALEPAASRTIEVRQFVPNEVINHQWYERAYYLGPDGHPDEYAALVAALADQSLEGVARWVMRKKTYIGSLQANHGHLLMVTLRHADEVISASSLPRPEGRALDKREIDLARQLVEALHTDFDPSQYQDEYRQRVLAFIEAKAKGRRPKLRLVKAPRPTGDERLASILSASVKSAKRARISA